MSPEDLNRDRELLIEEYEAAKAALGPIDRKLKRFYVACREIGANACESNGNVAVPRIENGKLAIGFAYNRFSPEDLMNAAELTALLVEQEKAWKRLRDAADAKHEARIY